MSAAMMDVVVCVEPGNLAVERRRVPQPGPHDVLIRVRHVGVCGTDMHIYRGTQPYLNYPRVIGHELSGEVVAAPKGSSLQAGDPVYVVPYMSCGSCASCRKGKPNCCMQIQVLGVHRDGGLAQFLCVPERFVYRADGVSLEQAAMIEFLAIGAHAVRRAAPNAGQRVLICGAGPIGIACALFARLTGADLTIVDTRQERLTFCQAHLGVTQTLVSDAVMKEQLDRLTGGEMFDVVFDATGSAAAMQAGFQYVAHGGTYTLVSVVAADITFSDPEFHRREMTLMGSRNAVPADFEFVLSAIRGGTVPTSALNTHVAKLCDVPTVLPQWMAPGAGVIKAIVTC